jgi:hypothetical protein
MKKEDLIIQRIDDLKESTDQRLDSIDENLREHMRRTDVLEKLHRDNESRIALLEEPRKALLLLKNVLLYVSACIGAILSIMKLWGK